jgi:RNA polymerase sigma-70 factor (ECF subfamily)
MTDGQDNELDRLMQRAGAGDEAAFRRFYDQTAPAILAFLMRMLRDRFLAEDVLQETMVIAWNKARDFDPALAAAKTWITTIARRRALDLIRSRKRHAEVMALGAPDIRAVLGLETERSAVAESGQTAGRLADCMGQLNTEAAACIGFAYLDGLTYAEIAEHIERSLGTVKSWIRRGLGKLKVCMQG